MAHHLQVDLPIIMGTGNNEGLGDPGMKGVLLKLAHPRRDTCGANRERAGFRRLRHPQGIDDHPNSDLQKVVLITLGPKDPSHFGKLLLQPGSDALSIQPSIHRHSKIRPEGVGHPTRLVVLLDGPVTILTGFAMLRAKSFLGPA